MVRKTSEKAEAPAKRSRSKTAEDAPAKRSRAKPAEEAPAKRTTRSKSVEPASEKRTRSKPAEEASTKRTRSKVVESDESDSKKPTGFNPYAGLDDTLDAIEKHVGLSESSMEAGGRLSTGNLMLDIILGGGITAGWYTNFGQEQSCKTTGAVTIMSAAINADVPILYYWDYEGSASPDYIENIMRNIGVKSDVKSIFGVRDEKTGKYIVPPRVRYKSEAVAEKFFDTLASLERKLPDKKKIGSQWYYIYEDTKDNRKVVGNNYDMNYWRKTQKLRVPAEDGALQALILVDSYPAMLPETQDVEDPNNAIATQARMFADQLKRVKGRMRGKRIAVIGINQLRKVPMAMYGPTENEPCGEALKLYSDVRLKFTSRSLSGAPEAKGKGQVEEEPSVTIENGVDNYRYIHVRGHKNKLSRPYLEQWLRLWITDGHGNAQGFDPVFDTYQYLKLTGQLSGKRAKMQLQFKGNVASKAIDWMDFKTLILGTASDMKAIYSRIGMKPIKLRAKCFDQMASGLGIEMFNAAEIAERTTKKSKEVNTDGDDGDDDND